MKRYTEQLCAHGREQYVGGLKGGREGLEGNIFIFGTDDALDGHVVFKNLHQLT